MSVMNMWPGAWVIIRGDGRSWLLPGGYAACPEDGDFAVFEFDGFAEVGGVDVADADGGGVADVDWSAVDCGEAGCYLHGADDLLLRDWAHGDDHGA